MLAWNGTKDLLACNLIVLDLFECAFKWSSNHAVLNIVYRAKQFFYKMVQVLLEQDILTLSESDWCYLEGLWSGCVAT